MMKFDKSFRVSPHQKFVYFYRLVESGQKNVMVSEKEYELSDWYPRAEYRKQKSLLNSTHSIHVVSSRSGVELIEDMIKMAGGSVVKVKSLADVIISDTPIETEKTVVTDGWLFDMIEQWQCKLRVFKMCVRKKKVIDKTNALCISPSYK